MALNLSLYFPNLLGDPVLLTVTLLTVAVLLVNGWTDAPNAIAAAVVTGALPFRQAVALAAVCNFLGVLCVTAVTTSVAETVYSIARFSGGPRTALTALCAAMAAIVLWAAAAWVFGIPTSESHALVAGLTGAAVALEGDLSCIQWDCWGRVLLGLLLSTGVGFGAGRVAGRAMSTVRAEPHTLRRWQIPGAMVTAFLHGAQDGQKFLGVFLLALSLAQGGQGQGTFAVPLWLMAGCALCMAAGTGLGGRRIIDKVGREMVELGPREGVASDLGGGACLLAATVLGLPVSTTHTRTAALLGVGSVGTGRTDWGVAGSIACAWLLTFPGCAALGYWMSRLFLALLG